MCSQKLHPLLAAICEEYHEVKEGQHSEFYIELTLEKLVWLVPYDSKIKVKGWLEGAYQTWLEEKSGEPQFSSTEEKESYETWLKEEKERGNA